MKTRRSLIVSGLGFGLVLVTAGAFGVVRPSPNITATQTSMRQLRAQPAALVTAISRAGRERADVAADEEARVASFVMSRP